jgi:hypothetical protein
MKKLHLTPAEFLAVFFNKIENINENAELQSTLE